MTTQEFIKRKYQLDNGREQWCSSVLKDHEGNMYSYGYHYPLVFRINGLDFVNVRGYSSSTSKHILWARQAVPDAIPVKLPAGVRLREVGMSDILDFLRAEFKELTDEMAKKKRKDTYVYQHLEHQTERVARDGHKVRAAL